MTMIHLLVGLDRRTLAPWHHNIREDDAASATRAALARVGVDGVDLAVAAVIGPGSSVLDSQPTPFAYQQQRLTQPRPARSGRRKFRAPKPVLARPLRRQSMGAPTRHAAPSARGPRLSRSPGEAARRRLA
jgi:hypothetical protein